MIRSPHPAWEVGVAQTSQIPFVEGFFQWPSEDPRLLGSRCLECDDQFFPPGFQCPNPTCTAKQVEVVAFPRAGVLASYTVVRYPPPPPFVPSDPFEPFAIAEVEFENGVQVIGPVPAADGLDLHIGSPMETIVDTYYTTEDGDDIVGWKFRPVADQP